MGYLLLNGETYAVSKTVTGKYNLANLVSDILEGQYSIVTDILVSDVLDCRYKLAGAIGKSWTGIYDIYNALGDTLEGQYSITEDFVVSDTLDSRWNIRQNVSDTLRFKYIIKTYIPSVVWDGDLEVDVSLNVDATVNSDGTVDLVAKQGSTWLLTLTIKQSTGAAMDLTDYTARGMIRKKYKSEDPIEEFHCTVLTPKADGQIEVTLSATETALVPAKTYVYDIEIENNTGYVTRVMQGKLKVDPEVTK